MDDHNSTEVLPVLALVRDLIFASRITATARIAGIKVRVLRDPEELVDEPGRLLVVDLNQAGAIEAAARWKQSHAGEVIGFVSHVDTATIDQSRRAGLVRILARSAFVQSLPTLLGEGTAES
jgi:hypothetical protein